MKNAIISETRTTLVHSTKPRPYPNGLRISSPKPVNGKVSAQNSREFTRLEKLAATLTGNANGPKIVFLYQDHESHCWAKKVSEKITRLTGGQGQRTSWWKINDLTAPGILAGAVSSALRADLIVVATQAQGLPLPFYVWVNLWWPNKSEAPGALLAITGAPDQILSRADRIGDYLRVVAEQAHMNFLLLEKRTPGSKKSLPNNANSNGAINSYAWTDRLHD
jgi:hypothetical protein